MKRPRSSEDLATRARIARGEATGATVLSNEEIRDALGDHDIAQYRVGAENGVRGVTLNLTEERVKVPDPPTVSSDPFDRPIFEGQSPDAMEVIKAHATTREVRPGEQLTIHNGEPGLLVLPHRLLRCLLMRVDEKGQLTNEVIGEVSISQGGEIAWTEGSSPYHTPASAGLVVHPEESPCSVSFVEPLKDLYRADHSINPLDIEAVDLMLHNLAGHFSKVLERQNGAATSLGFHFKPHPYSSISEGDFQNLAQRRGAVKSPLQAWTTFLPHQLEKEHPHLRGPKLLIAQAVGWVAPYDPLRKLMDAQESSAGFLYLMGDQEVGPIPTHLQQLVSQNAVARISGGTQDTLGRTAILEMYALKPHDPTQEHPPSVFVPSKPGGSVLAVPLPDLSQAAGRLDLRRLAAQELILKAAGTADSMTRGVRALEAQKLSEAATERTGLFRKVLSWFS